MDWTLEVVALQLVVSDAKAARRELADRGVEVSDLMVMAPTGGSRRARSMGRPLTPGT